MKRQHQPNLTLLLLATLAAIGLLLHLSHRGAAPVQARELSPKQATSTLANPSSTAPDAAPSQATASETIGATILGDYANPITTPQQDLTSLARLMDNFTLLVKTAVDHPLAANEDWSNALRGFNPSHQRFLPDVHPVLNAQHELVDRWGSPLFFHAEARGQYAVRSAGPDRRLWTSDDIQRNSDGSFAQGGDLKPVELPSR